MGRASLRMPAEAADPVVQVVDGDEQHVRRALRFGTGGADMECGKKEGRKRSNKCKAEHQRNVLSSKKSRGSKRKPLAHGFTGRINHLL